MTHYAFETTDIRQLRDYLAAHGVKVPGSLKPGLDKNLSMMVKDPEGHDVEFVQYMPGSLHSSYFGKLLPPTGVSRRMIHVGVTIHDREAADRFYKDLLGFKMTWHGGMTDSKTDWVDMRVPEGTDWLEYMLNAHNPSPKQLGVLHHFALGVDNIQTAYQTVQGRGYRAPQPPKIGRDGKWQLNLYDPNDTRAELMEFKPVQTPCCSPMLSLLHLQ
jgi:catechol 2,3-dioxygenase-like lactoylglutathione lyase family enzyme